MSFSLCFWILMLLWAVFGIFPGWPRGENVKYGPFAGTIILFVLIGLLGWKTFGPPIHG